MWKKYPGFDYIIVSDKGEVKRVREVSIKGWKAGVIILKPQLNKNGYYGIGWTIDRKHYERLIHRMVLETFVGPCPKGMETRHLDCNKLNNKLSNLCWGTQQENLEDNIRAGTDKPGAKLKPEDITKIRWMLKHTWSHKHIAEEFDVTPATISSIKLGKSWKDYY